MISIKHMASIAALSITSLLLGAGCMAQADDTDNTDDQADKTGAQAGETKEAAVNQDSATDEHTGESKEALCGGWGGYYGGFYGGCGGCGGLGYGGFGYGYPIGGFYGGGCGGGCGGFYGGCGGFYGGCGAVVTPYYGGGCF